MMHNPAMGKECYDAAMPRSGNKIHRKAINTPGHAHELTFSCYHRFQFLKAERTCQWLADAINAARTKCNISLWAYVFMPDHVHLLIYPNEPDYNISAILKAIKQPVHRRLRRPNTINHGTAGV